jgi:hypothetical protein
VYKDLPTPDEKDVVFHSQELSELSSLLLELPSSGCLAAATQLLSFLATALFFEGVSLHDFWPIFQNH